MFKLRTVLAVAFVVVGSTVGAGAQTTRSVPTTAYPTIQSAITASSAGDSVSVAGGTYFENLDFQGKAISVGAGAVPSATVINGSGAGPVVTIQGASANGAQLNGFTITNGGKPQTSGGPQGGIYIANASPIISSNTITGNYCAGVVVSKGNPVIELNTITQTLTTGCAAMEGLGSGLAVSGTSTGLAAPQQPAAPVILSNTITGNTASVLYASDKGGGGAINITNASAVYVTLNTLSNNTSTGYGGAMYVATTPSLYFINNLVFGNKGISGGLDIVVPGSSVGPLAGLLADNTIVDNTATASTGGSDVYIGGNLAQYALVNNIIVGDVAKEIALDCGTTYANQTITPLVLDHNDFYSSVGTAVGGACTSPAGQNGNISADPQFVSGTPAAVTAGTQNFQVGSSGSPVVDAGNNSIALLPTTDIAGKARSLDATSKGYAVVDMGAYEFAGTNDIAATAVLLTPSSYTPITGASLTLTAALSFSFGTPPGTVTFLEDGATIGTGLAGTAGTATYTLAAVTAGLHTFVAVYPGGYYNPPYTNVLIPVPPGISVNLLLEATTPASTVTQTTLASTPNPSYQGQTVTFTTHTSSASGIIPSGQVEYTDGSVTLGIVPVDASGNSTFSTSTLAVGGHSITAGYVPTSTFNGSTASLTQTVLGAASMATLVATPTTAAYGTAISGTATVSPAAPPGVTPTGTVTFTVDGVGVGSGALVAGAASFSFTNVAAGTHTLGCTYPGDGVYAASVCTTVGVTVAAGASALTIATSKNPAAALTPVTFMATLTAGGAPVAGATITFSVGAVMLTGTTNAAGVATVSSMPLPVGSYIVTANFAGNASAGPSTAQLTEVVTPNATSLALTAAPNPAYQGQTVTLAVEITDLPGTASPVGTVTFYDGGSAIGSVATSGVVTGNPLTSLSLGTSSLAAGTHSITAMYVPDGNSLGSTSGVVSVVVLASSFTFTADAPSLTIETEHHASLGLHVTSVGGFSGPIALACGKALPPVVTCELAAAVSLPANGTVGTTLTLDTDAILGYKSSVERAPGFGVKAEWMAWALLLPLLGIGRRRVRGLGIVLILLGLGTLVGLSGCSGKYPANTPPGTYDILLTATGTAPGGSLVTTQVIDLKLVVTP